MAQVLSGLVMDVERRSYIPKGGSEPVDVCEVYVAAGRDTIKTTGQDEDYSPGEKVCLQVQFASWRNTDEVHAKRLAKLADGAAVLAAIGAE